ncbi:MAG: AAA family ATPase [Chloroflexi bacterium]|nr:AAA family ATPase [Chloroflexota bacterium]
MTTAIVIDSRPRERQQAMDALRQAGLSGATGLDFTIANTAHLREAAPAFVFVAFEEPHQRALQAIEQAAAVCPDSVVVAYSSDTSVAAFQAAVRAGARFMLESPLSPAELGRVLNLHTRKAAAPAEPLLRGRVIAVVGQKGGIGKTTISTNLAAALAGEAHSSTVIVDFDTNFGDVGLAFDVHGDYTAGDLASGLDSLDRESFKDSLVLHESGAYVLPAPRHVGDWLHVEPEQLEALVDAAASMFDHVIIDTPGAFNDTVAAALALADHAFIVTSLEVTSIKNTALLLDLLKEEEYPEERILVIVNNTSPDPGVTAMDVAHGLNAPSVWEVKFDNDLRHGTQVGRPAATGKDKSAGAQSLRALALRIATSPDQIDRRAAVRGQASQNTAQLADRLRKAMTRVPLGMAPNLRLKGNAA